MQREYTIPRELEKPSRIVPAQKSVNEFDNEVRGRIEEREREIQRERELQERMLREYRAD